MSKSAHIITPGNIAGGIAQVAITDLRDNHFAYPGFPQIHISENNDDSYTANLSWTKYNSSFSLTNQEAKTLAVNFKADQNIDRDIFNKVQQALAVLDSKKSNRVYP